MPTTGELKLNPGTKENPDSGYRSRFSHQREKSVPGYYEVELDDYNVKVQLTATQCVGVHKYTFPKDGQGSIILDLNHGIYNYDGKVLWASIRVESPTLITGYRITNGWARTNYTYFAISFSQPVTNYGYKDMEQILYKGFWRKFPVNTNFPEMAGQYRKRALNYRNIYDPQIGFARPKCRNGSFKEEFDVLQTHDLE